MEGWPEARVRDGHGSVEIKAPAARTLEPITTRLLETVPLGRNKFFVPIDFADDKTLLGYTDQGGAAVDIDAGRLDVRIPWPSEPRVFRVVLSADRKTMFVGRIGTRSEQLVEEGKTKTVSHPIGRLDAYDVSTARKLTTFDGRERSTVYDVKASPDGRWLASCERRGLIHAASIPWKLMLWDLESNRSKELAAIDGDVVFTPDSKQLYCTEFNNRTRVSTLHRWHIDSLKHTVVETAKEAAFYLPTFSDDGRWTVFMRRPFDQAKPVELELRDRVEDKVMAKTTLGSGGLDYAVFDPKNRSLAVVDGGTGVRLLDLKTMKSENAFGIPKKATAWFPQFSPDGTRFSIVTFDMSDTNPRSSDPSSTVQPILWLLDLNRPTKPERAVLPPFRASRSNWTPDGKRVVVTAADRLWILDATNVSGGEPTSEGGRP
jgi:WD40 repeat protein